MLEKQESQINMIYFNRTAVNTTIPSGEFILINIVFLSSAKGEWSIDKIMSITRIYKRDWIFKINYNKI